MTKENQEMIAIRGGLIQTSRLFNTIEDAQDWICSHLDADEGDPSDYEFVNVYEHNVSGEDDYSDSEDDEEYFDDEDYDFSKSSN